MFKYTALEILAAFGTLFPANGLFHAVVAAAFLDRRLAALGPSVLPMHDARTGAVAVLDFTLAVVVVYVVRADRRPSLSRAALAGLLVNLASSVAWNLGNMATFTIWPVDVTLVDVAWHCAIGAAAGSAAFAVHRRASAAVRHAARETPSVHA